MKSNKIGFGQIGRRTRDRENWLKERTRLLEKNELAKTKVEAMIMRLRALEQE